MFDVNIISTGSIGNFNIIDGVIAIDVGVKREVVEPYLNGLDHVLISHEHKDHANPAIIRMLYQKRPGLFRHGLHMNASTVERLSKAGKWAPDAMSQVTDVIDGRSTRVLKTRKGDYTLTTYPLEHDVENQGFILENPAGELLIHATDTTTMEHAPYRQYDALLIEGNWDENRLVEALENVDVTTVEGARFFQRATQNFRHLSVQACRDFLNTHSKVGSQIYQLHESAQFGLTMDHDGISTDELYVEDVVVPS